MIQVLDEFTGTVTGLSAPAAPVITNFNSNTPIQNFARLESPDTLWNQENKVDFRAGSSILFAAGQIIAGLKRATTFSLTPIASKY